MDRKARIDRKDRSWIEVKINFVASKKLATSPTTVELINFTISP